MPARDGLGRPVAAGSSEQVDGVEERYRTAAEAITDAQEQLDLGRPFFAHEVLEGRWKSCPIEERDCWRGLTQLCVGLTHLQRGNIEGAVTLLRRGASYLSGRVAAWGRDEADRLERGDLEVSRLRLPGCGSPRP